MKKVLTILGLMAISMTAHAVDSVLRCQVQKYEQVQGASHKKVGSPLNLESKLNFGMADVDQYTTDQSALPFKLAVGTLIEGYVGEQSGIRSAKIQFANGGSISFVNDTYLPMKVFTNISVDGLDYSVQCAIE